MTLARIQRIGMALVALALVVLPFIFADQNYVMRLITTAACFAIAVYGMNIILGFTGQLSLAHGGFFGIGVYTVGLLTTDYDWDFWPSLLAAVALTALLGYLAGLIALRTREEYFAIFTMALGTLVYLVISRWESVTHAHTGVNGVKFPEGFGILDFSEPILMYFLVLVVLAGVAYVTYSLRQSGLGRGLVAIRASEDLASSIGVNVGVNKQLAFTASTAIAGLAGGLYASVQGFVGPGSASINITFEMLMFVLVGGLGTVMGPIVGSFAVLFLFESFQGLDSYRFVILGPVIIAIVIFAPRGVVGYLNAFVAKLLAKGTRSAAAQPAADRRPAADTSAASAGAQNKEVN